MEDCELDDDFSERCGSVIVKYARAYIQICPEAFCHRDRFSQRPVVTEAPVAPEAREAHRPASPEARPIGRQKVPATGLLSLCGF